MNLTLVAEAVELPKSTALRFLRDLEEAGWVARDNAGVYSLGATVVGLAAQYIAHNEMVAAAAPAMRDLRDKIDETVSLSRRVGLIRVCVQEFPSRKALRLVLGVGERGPLHAGASGGRAPPPRGGRVGNRSLARAAARGAFSTLPVPSDRSE